MSQVETTQSSPPRTVVDRDTPEVTGCPRGPDATYLLVYNNPDAPSASYGPGWTLTGWHASTRCWSQSLDAHGAGATTGTRAAKAVAVRVLADQGLTIEAWRDNEARDHDTGGELAMYRAALRTTTERH